MRLIVPFLVGLLLPIIVVYALLHKQPKPKYIPLSDQDALTRYIEELPGD